MRKANPKRRGLRVYWTLNTMENAHRWKYRTSWYDNNMWRRPYRIYCEKTGVEARADQIVYAKDLQRRRRWEVSSQAASFAAAIRFLISSFSCRPILSGSSAHTFASQQQQLQQPILMRSRSSSRRTRSRKQPQRRTEQSCATTVAVQFVCAE
jgi:hypothetical protein